MAQMNFLFEMVGSWTQSISLENVEDQCSMIKNSKTICTFAKCLHNNKLREEDDLEGEDLDNLTATSPLQASFSSQASTISSPLISFLYKHHQKMPLKVLLLLLSIQGENLLSESFSHFLFLFNALCDRIITNHNLYYEEAPLSVCVFFVQNDSKTKQERKSSSSLSSTPHGISSSSYIPENLLYRFSERDMKCLQIIFHTVTKYSLNEKIERDNIVKTFYKLFPLFMLNKKSFLIQYDLSLLGEPERMKFSPTFCEESDSHTYLSFFLIYFIKLLCSYGAFSLVWDLLSKSKGHYDESILEGVFPRISSLNGLNPKVDLNEYFMLLSKLIFYRHEKNSFYFFPLSSYSQLLTLISLDPYIDFQSDHGFIRLKILSLISTGEKISFKKLRRNLKFDNPQMKFVSRLESEFSSLDYSHFSALLESNTNFFSSNYYDDLYPLLKPAWRLWKLKNFSSCFSTALLSSLLQYLGYINNQIEENYEEIKSTDLLNVLNYFSLLKSLNISYPSLSPLTSSSESSYSNDMWITFSTSPTCQDEQNIVAKNEEKKELEEIFAKISSYSHEINKLAEEISKSKSNLFSEKN